MIRPDPAGNRVDFEKRMSMAPLVPVLGIGAAVAAFAWQVRSGWPRSLGEQIETWGVHGPALFRGEWWRVGTGVFLHADLNHLFGNCVMLYIAGLGCEHGFGPSRTLLIFVASALGATAAGIFVNAHPSIGISGVVFGLIAALIAFFSRNRSWVHLRDYRIAVVFAVWAGWSIFSGFADPHIDNLGHLGGFLAGAFAGLAFSGHAESYS